MRRFCTTIVLALATFLSISICSAQQAATTSVPNLVRYSGTLKDAQGAALSSSTAVGVTFSVYKQQDGGAAVWMETQNVTPDANGQYNVILGSTTATGLPDDLFLQQEQRWLGVQVQGEAEQARVLLVSVPYAFKAHEAETLGGLPASAFVKAPPSDGSGSPSTGAGTAVNAAGIAVSTKTTAATDTSGVLPLGMQSLDGIDFWGRTPAGVARHDYTATSETNPDVSNKIFIGGDNTNAAPSFPPIPFDNIKVGLATHSISKDSKLSIFDPTTTSRAGNPSLDILTTFPSGIKARGQLAVSTSPGFYSNISVAGDVVLRADADTGVDPNFTATKSLILAARNASGVTPNLYQGAIRFTTGINSCAGGYPCETEKMTLLAHGNFGVGNNKPQQLFAVGPGNGVNNSPFEVSNIGDMVRIKSVAYSWPILPQPATGRVLTVMTGGLVATLAWMPPSGGGNVVGPNPPCAAGFLPKWSGGLNVDCSVVYQQPGTNNIGIGTTNPSEALDVAGDISANPHGTPDRSSYQIGETTVLTAFGSGNTVVGFTNAHATNTGTNNTFVGAAAGTSNNTGARNTFVGSQAGQANNTGVNNTFVGWLAGTANNLGASNTFTGLRAGQSNLGGNFNDFYGVLAGSANTVGTANNFIGHLAGGGNVNGNNNIFIGESAGQFNVSGSGNVYLGTQAGQLAGGNNNIDILNQGVAGDNNTIRIGGNNGIGYPPQTDTYVLGIWGSAAGGASDVVCVDANGKLWGAPFHADCTLSSRRFKDQIVDMGDSTSKLLQLRPVTFFYKPQYDDGSHALQFGLIAEEVAKVYPEMVAYDKDGQPYTVKYQMLTPMLLNELQKQHTVVAAQQDELQTQLQQIKTQRQQMQAQRHEIDGLKLQLQQQNASLQERLSKLESYVATQMKVASDNPPRTTPGANGGLQ